MSNWSEAPRQTEAMIETGAFWTDSLESSSMAIIDFEYHLTPKGYYDYDFVDVIRDGEVLFTAQSLTDAEELLGGWLESEGVEYENAKIY